MAGVFSQQGALPDIVPGQQSDIPRLDLIAEEIVISGGPTSNIGDTRGNNVHLEVGAACDRSDTWSVDATASDSEAEVLRNEDRMKEFDECSGSASATNSIQCSADPYSSNNSVATIEMPSAPPEIMFPVDAKSFEDKRNLR